MVRASRVTTASIGLALFGAIGIAYTGASHTIVFVAAVTCSLMVLVAVLAYRWPRHVLLAAPAVIFLAGTKFRARDARASLALEIDAQIVFELALYGVVGVGLLAVVASRFVRLSRPTMMELLLVAFVAVVLLSLLWTSAPVLGAVRAIQMSTLLFWALLATRTLSAQDTLSCVGVALTGWVLLFAGAALVMPPTAHEGPVDLTRFFWFSMHPIQCATFAALALIFVAARTLLPEGRRGARHMMLALACLALLLVIVLATRSRGPFIALVAAMAMLLALRFLGSWRAPLTTALVAILALYYLNVGLTPADLLTVLTSSDSRVVEFLVRNQSMEQLTSLTGRADLWALASELIRERPLFGYGYQSSRGLLLDDFSWASYAHNAFVQVILEVGLLGGSLIILALLASMAIVIVRRTRQRVSWRQGFVAGALVFLIINASTAESFAAAPGFELMLVFLCALLSRTVAAEGVQRSETAVRIGGFHTMREPTSPIMRTARS